MIQIGHTPDPDDAFMFYYLSKIAKDSGIELVLDDIESLNKKVIMNAIDCSAVSFYTYFKVAHRYDLLSVGACFGENYGPILVEKKIVYSQPKEVVAVPGMHTTAFLLLKIYNNNLPSIFCPFDRIPGLVIDEKVKYGILIHEMQQTYSEYGLAKAVDLGEYWFNLTNLPLPLGCIVIRKGFPDSIKRFVKETIKKSLQYSLTHKEEALEYAMEFARFTQKKDTQDFINKYVKDFSLEIYGPYRKSIDEMLKIVLSHNLISTKIVINII
ncbi:MAG: MqnA/MqnD/SBP family protein [Planctomycetota bacterium]